MIYLLLVLFTSKAHDPNSHELVVSYSDFDYLVDIGVLSEPKALEVWKILSDHIEMTNPSKTSNKGFVKSSEIQLFGVLPLMSIIMTIGSVAMLLALYWLLGLAQDSQSAIKIISISGLCSFTSISLSYSLYETYGIVVITWVIMMAGLNFLYVFLEQIIRHLGYEIKSKNFFDFNEIDAGITAVVSIISYYYSLFIAFPLFQLPFYLGGCYLIMVGAKILEEKVNKGLRPLNAIAFVVASLGLMLYLLLAKEGSFLAIGQFAFIDFRFVGFIVSSVAFTVSFPIMIYGRYCYEYNANYDIYGIINSHATNNKASDEWMPYSKYLVMIIAGYTIFFGFGMVFRILPAIILGYIGITVFIIFLPSMKYSNAVYQLLIVFLIIFSAALGQISDPTALQLIAFYPKSYFLPFCYFVLRVICLGVCIVNAKIYRSRHYKQHTTADIVLDFFLGYIRTITLIVLGEYESSWAISWVYTIGIVLNIDPTLKIQSNSHQDDLIKCFSLLFYGLRISLISYNLSVAFYTGVFLMLVGAWRCKLYSERGRIFKIAFYLYLWLLLQFDCCLNSWSLLIATGAAISIAADIKEIHKGKIGEALGLAAVGALLSFIISASSVCIVFLNFEPICNAIANPNSYFPEKAAIYSILTFFRE